MALLSHVPDDQRTGPNVHDFEHRVVAGKATRGEGRGTSGSSVSVAMAAAEGLAAEGGKAAALTASGSSRRDPGI